MISRCQLVTMAVVYTVLIFTMVAVMDNPPAAPVFGVAAAWFSIGRAWERLPARRHNPETPVKWGRP